jgi:RNA polymerase sigma-70 factor (ECF subfamily)
MHPGPQTRRSLLVRLQGTRDEAAWDEFAAIYEPLVYRLARQRGWQDADARELSQEVLLAVAKSIERWDLDASRGSFRGWLFRIARNLMINYWKRRRRQPVAAGGSERLEFFASQPAPDGLDAHSQWFDQEYRRELFRWAAEKIRGEFRAPTWDAFWLTCVEGRPIANIAAQLNMSLGAAYVARSRVMARLRTVVQAHEDESRA